MKHYIVAYDIVCTKRAYRVRKLVYSYTMSGQKSALEVFVDKKGLNELKTLLKSLIKKGDSVNIIEVSTKIMLFGKADKLNYDNGVIII